MKIKETGDIHVANAIQRKETCLFRVLGNLHETIVVLVHRLTVLDSMGQSTLKNNVVSTCLLSPIL